jgi:hypothetical protein
MYLAATTSSSSSTPTIIVAVIAAVASVIAAVIAARSARSSKRIEIQAQRIRDLESRISERKYNVYEPFLEMIGNFFDQTEKGRAAIADPTANVERFVGFAKQITTYGSDEVVEAYHKFVLATSNNPPVNIMTRLMADFLLAVRKDLSYPDTQISGTTLIATSFRVGDFYSQGRDFQKIMTLPLTEACKLANWPEPWVFRAAPAVGQPQESSQAAPPTAPLQGLSRDLHTAH